MTPHLLFLWCAMQFPQQPAMQRYEQCDQSIAFKIEDAGPAPESDGCSAAFERWLARGELAAAHNDEILSMVCEVPK